jgi:predicted transcriptional regulator
VPIGVVSSRNVVDQFVAALEHCSDPYLAENVKLNDIFNQLCRKSSRLCYVSTGDTVYKALQVMQEVDIGAVFVTRSNNLAGIFTERDYLNKIILQGTTDCHSILNYNRKTI